jgi:serine O-acetyltransferase
MLYFKGFQAVQCYRISHYLWQRGRRALAVAIQSRISEAFQVCRPAPATAGRVLP